MKLHRFIRKKFDFGQDQLTLKDRELIHQISNVLRMGEGDELILSDGNFGEAKVKIESVNKKEIVVRILNRFQNQKESDTYVTLYCSILKNKNFDLVAQKCTEVGVKEIVPIISERTVKTGLKRRRLKKIIREAAEQSGRGIVPKLRKKIQLTRAVQNNSDAVVFDEDGEEVSEMSFENNNLSIFIGPEGGWSEKEKQLFKEKDFTIVKLSDLTFRAETAAIAGSFVVLT